MFKMRFNIMGIIFMAVAIGLGNLVGSGVASFIGFAGGIVGSIIVGLIIYAIYCVLTGQKMRLWGGILFAVLVWLANIIAGVIYGATGFGGGIIGLLITAIVASLLWGTFGKGMGTSGKRRGRRRRRR